jgi:glyoxylase-like metal-dependent hydrolase (beta-lactamase superfamily II)
VSPRALHTIDADVLPRFTAVYLRITGEECAFIEAHTAHALPRLLATLAAAGRRPEDVRWVVVTHAHLDHAAGASALLRACPNATLLAHPRAAKNLIDPEKLVKSATAVYGEARFAELYGTIDPIPAERVRELEDGATFELGGDTLTALHTSGHANHHFAVHDPARDTVYTGDTFGLVYPDLQAKGRFAIASTSPANFDPPEARKSLDRLVALGTRSVCLTHFGEHEDVAAIAAQVRSWVDRGEAWLEECRKSDAGADADTARLARAVRAAIVAESEARSLGFGKAELSLLATDIALNAQGVVAVAEAERRRAAKAAAAGA